MKAPQKKPIKRGRTKGKTTGYTQAGLSLSENKFQAKHGKWHPLSLGATFTHQLWITRNPQPTSLIVRLRAEAYGETPAEALAYLREFGRSEIPPQLRDWLLDAIDRRDPQFFREAADQLERIRSDGTLICDDPQEAALTVYALEVRAHNKAHRFTVAELLDALDWQGWHTQCPSEGNLKRLCQKLRLPMQRGRPRKKGPISRN